MPREIGVLALPSHIGKAEVEPAQAHARGDVGEGVAVVPGVFVGVPLPDGLGVRVGVAVLTPPFGVGVRVASLAR